MRRTGFTTILAGLLALSMVAGAAAQGPIKIGEINSFSGIGAPFTGPYRAAELVQPDSDVHASAEYRRHLTRVLTARAIKRALRVAGP